MKPFATLTFLGLFAVSLWWLLSTDSDSGTTNFTTDSQPVSIPTESATDLDVHSEPKSESVQREATVSTTDEAAPGSFLVTVVRADTEEVMPDFEVTWLETPRDRHYPYQEWDALVAANGVVARTDAKGQLRLSQNGTNMLLIAKGLGLYGRMLRTYRAESDTLRLEVLPDQSLTVTVTHADGTPAVDYRVVYAERYGNFGSRESSFTRTNKDGVGVLEHLQIPLSFASADHVQSIIIGLPTRPAVAQDFSLAKGLPKTMEFILPVEATVRVIAEQHNGKPFPDGTKIYLQSGTRPRFNPNPLGGFDTRLSKDGFAEFPVGLNVSLEYAVFIQEHREYFSAVDKGPISAGETVELRLIQKEAPTVLVGRLLDANGEPLPNVTFRGRVKTVSMSMGVRLQTDAEGKFRLSIRNRKMRKQDDDEPLPYRFLNLSYLHPDGIQIWCHLLDLSYDLEPGENDMGDIQLSSDLIVSGIVVDAATESPLTDVDLRFDGASQNYQGWGQRPVHFEYVIHSFATNNSGRFEVRGNLAIHSLQTPAEKPDYLPNQFALTVGAADQILPLESGKGMRVQILLDADIPHHNVRLKLKGLGDRKGTTWGMSFVKEPDGIFSSFLPIGDFDLSLITELEQTILSIDAVRVEIDSPQDQRLDPIDLRGLLYQRTIHVTGPLGEDPDFFMIATEEDLDGSQKANHSATLTPSATWTPYVWADSKEVRPLIQSAESFVQLQPSIQGLIRFTDPPQLPDGAEVTLLIYRKEDYQYRQSMIVHLDEVIKLGFRTPGIYDLRLDYKKQGERANQHLLLDDHWQTTLEVVDSTAAQEFSFRVDSQAEED